MKPSFYSPSSSTSTEMAAAVADVKPELVEATNGQRSAASGAVAASGPGSFSYLSMISCLGIRPGLGAADGLDVSGTRSVASLEHYSQSTAQQFAFAATSATRVPLLAFPNYAAASAGPNQQQQLLLQSQQQQLQINQTQTPALLLPPPPPLRWTGGCHAHAGQLWTAAPSTRPSYATTTYSYLLPTERSTFAPVQYCDGSHSLLSQMPLQQNAMRHPARELSASLACANGSIEGSKSKSSGSGRRRSSSGRRNRSGARTSGGDSSSTSCTTHTSVKPSSGIPQYTATTSMAPTDAVSDIDSTAQRPLAPPFALASGVPPPSEEAEGDRQRPGRKKGFAGRRPDGSRHNEPLNPSVVVLMEQWFAEHMDDPYPTEEDKQRFTQDGTLTLHFVIYWPYLTMYVKTLYHSDTESQDNSIFNSVAELVSRSQVNAWFANKRNRTNSTRPKRKKIALENNLVHLCEFIYQSRLEASGGGGCTFNAASAPSGLTGSTDMRPAGAAASSSPPFGSASSSLARPLQLASASITASASASTSAGDFYGRNGLPLHCDQGPSAPRMHQSTFGFGAGVGAERIEQPMWSCQSSADSVTGSLFPALAASFSARSYAEAPTEPEDTSAAAKLPATASKA